MIKDGDNNDPINDLIFFYIRSRNSVVPTPL